ncbi:MAG: hypothetical protein DHS20C18_03940 [Saprospiraceae bacterium]|nr:MAG: hypothetical protein DHS20C18_03940 [Saprospiraceae bacterium]
MKKLSLVMCCLGLCTYLSAQETIEPYPKKTYHTQRIAENPPIIDGELSETCWNEVEWTGGYLQWDPDEGVAPTQETSFKILYDEKHLYLGFRCFDNDPEKIVKRMSRRDGFPGDWIEINIDSYHDLRTAFSFTISASGVKGDEFISNDGNNWDTNWNPIWYAKTLVDSLGWTAEVKIPLTQLRFSSQEEQVWGIQSTRRDFRMEERSTWQPIHRNDAAWVSRFGELHGIKGIKPQKQIELQPYLLGQLATFEKEEGNPFATGADWRLTGGLDGKIGVTNDLTIDFTVNPDFGQVEADPSALTLDGFQIFFSERRPFFIENRNIFDYRITGSEAGGSYDNDLLFYSRRIGGAPHHSIRNNPGNRYYVDQPENTTILGAAKFSGKTNKGLSIGILETVTNREIAKIDNQGVQEKLPVEPFANYFVGRLQQDFSGGNTVIGGILTAVNRDINDPGLEEIHRSAYSGGLDFLHRWKNRSWFVSGNVIASQIAGSEAAILNTQTAFEHLFQRPDADHLQIDSTATGLFGTGGTVKVGKTGGKWVFETGATWRSPKLELNDVGFLVNTDEVNYFFWGGRRWTQPFSIFRSLRVNYNHWSRWDFSGKNLYRAANTNAHASFKNFWSAGMGFTYENLDITKNALRGGPALRRPNGTGFSAYLNSDSRKKVNLYFNTFNAWGFGKTVRVQNYSIDVQVQPSNAMSITLSPGFDRFQRLDQYVAQQDVNGKRRYIEAEVDQQTLSMTLRLNYNITPDLTLQFYGQPFISRGHYRDFKRVTDAPLAKEFWDRHYTYNANEIQFDENEKAYLIDDDNDGAIDIILDKPDFNFFQFRSNLVARWEYIPGSEIFLVWTRSTTAADDPEAGLLDSFTENLFSEKARNIFLIKTTYRFAR